MGRRGILAGGGKGKQSGRWNASRTELMITEVGGFTLGIVV